MSFKIEHPGRQLALALALGALLLWGFYLKTLSPAFPPDDSAETIAAAYSLGIQHPPGYPLAALLGRCAIVAVPLGAPAVRVNLLSAALACMAAALAGALAWRLSRATAPQRSAAALVAMLALGSLAVFWDQATEAKGGLYLLNLALGFGLWHCALSASARTAWAWALLAGLMLADHYPSAVLWIAPSALWVFWVRRAPLVALLGVLPGLSLYAYLPLRAAAVAQPNWGDPRTWQQFWWVLGRGGYSQAFLAETKGIAASQAALWLASLKRGAWAWVPLLAFFGARELWAQQRNAAKAMLAAFALALIAALGFNKTTEQNRWLCLIFALPATALLAPWAGLGLARAVERWSLQRWALPLALLLGGAALWAQAPASDRSGSYVAWDYARDLSAGLPRNAIYFAEGDFHLVPLLHTQVVEGKRGDVLSVLNVLSGEPWYQGVLRRQDPALALPMAGPAESAVLELARLNAQRRPLAVSPYSVMLTPQRGVPLAQRGLPRLVSNAPQGLAQARAWSVRAPARPEALWEPLEAELLPWYTVALAQLGNEAMAQGRKAEAVEAFRRALQRPGPKPAGPLSYNLGLAYENVGRHDLARAAYERCAALDPSFAPAQERLGALRARN